MKIMNMFLNGKLKTSAIAGRKKNEVIRSPVFSAESIRNTKWTLSMKPRDLEGNSVSCYLHRELYDTGPPDITVCFVLNFLKEDGSVSEEETINYTFTKIKVEGYAFRQLLKRHVIFIEEKALFLPQDTLTVRCKLRTFFGIATKIVEKFARTVIGVEEKSFDWRIAEFSTMEPNEKKSGTIKLSSGEDILYLDIFLSAGGNTEKFIFINIRSFLIEIKFVRVKLFLKDTEGKMVECGQKQIYEDAVGGEGILPLYFTKNELLKKKDLYLKGRELSLCFVCAFTRGIAHEGIARTICRNFNEHCQYDGGKNPLSGGLKKNDHLKNDLQSLYNDNTLCDTTLCTQTRSFPAHIAILCARSPVLKAMYTSNMKETIQKRVDILDINDDTVQRMLLYMYTDTLESLQWENALSLYTAADKCGIMSLRNQCALMIEKLLTPTNVCRALVLADRHRDEDFNRILQNYILSNKRCVLDSEEWKMFMKSNSELASGIMFKIFMEE